MMTRLFSFLVLVLVAASCQESAKPEFGNGTPQAQPQQPQEQPAAPPMTAYQVGTPAMMWSSPWPLNEDPNRFSDAQKVQIADARTLSYTSPTQDVTVTVNFMEYTPGIMNNVSIAAGSAQISLQQQEGITNLSINSSNTEYINGTIARKTFSGTCFKGAKEMGVVHHSYVLESKLWQLMILYDAANPNVQKQVTAFLRSLSFANTQ